jgi:hypothetical protein
MSESKSNSMKAEKEYQKLVEKARELTDLDITYARSRRFEIVLVKAGICNIMSRYYGYTTTLIGSLMGFHHSTVIYHLQKHSDRYLNEEQYSETYDELTKFISRAEDSIIDVEDIVGKLRACLAV